MSTLKVDAIRHNSATSDAITTAADGTCTAKLTSVSGGQLSHRNIIVNGACMVAQRGTSSTSGGYQTVDRFPAYHTGGAVTQSQGTLTSGTPFDNGLPNYMRITNTTANTASDHARSIIYKIEAQDIRHSGWNYKSSSSYITFSFYVRSSVNQQFYIMARTQDGTQLAYPFSIGTLSADTWTKVTHSIPGNSNLTFDNNSDRGLEFFIYAALGTDFTSSSVSLNTWGAYTSSARLPDYANTWASTTNSTFDITGLQLEVGDTATSFEHRTYQEEILRCMRYYQQITGDDRGYNGATGSTGSFKNSVIGIYNGATDVRAVYYHMVPMRDEPTLTVLGAMSDFDLEPHDRAPSSISMNRAGVYQSTLIITDSGSATKGDACLVTIDNAAGGLAFSAEL